jgi:hypothetical protein
MSREAAESWDGRNKKGPGEVGAEQRLRVWFRNGYSVFGRKDDFFWHHSFEGGDIVAYEVIDEPSPAGDTHEMLTFGPLGTGWEPTVTSYSPDGNDSLGAGKQTNPKDVIGSKKAKVSVIPAGVLFDVGNAMVEGMCKYGRHNYRAAGVRSSVYYDAAMGHLMDWWEGQDIDPESGLSHVTKALASLVVLRDAMMQDMLYDDRPPRSKVFKPDFNGTTAEIIARHADKNPRHFTIADTKKEAA